MVPQKVLSRLLRFYESHITFRRWKGNLKLMEQWKTGFVVTFWASCPRWSKTWLENCTKALLGSCTTEHVLGHECEISSSSFKRKFFDCLNVQSQKECLVKRKPSLQPFQSTDWKIYWLENVLLKYLFDWKSTIMTRNGNFAQNARDRMFLSWPTSKGLQITVYSVAESVKYLLNSVLKFVPTEKFNQDVVEEYFGRQRSFCRRNDNPTLLAFGYNTNTIWMDYLAFCRADMCLFAN